MRRNKGGRWKCSFLRTSTAPRCLVFFRDLPILFLLCPHNFFVLVLNFQLKLNVKRSCYFSLSYFDKLLLFIARYCVKTRNFTELGTLWYFLLFLYFLFSLQWSLYCKNIEHTSERCIPGVYLFSVGDETFGYWDLYFCNFVKYFYLFRNTR